MKKIIISIAAILVGWKVLAQTADQDVTTGLNFLAAKDLVHANASFTAALALSPTHANANALLAATRLLLLPTQPASSSFLTSLGFPSTGRNIFDWRSTLPVDGNGSTILPSNNTSVMAAFYLATVMPALGASRTNLAMITDPNFNLSLTAGQTSLADVTVDYGDVLMLQTLVRMAEFLGNTINAQNFNVVLRQLQTLGNANNLTIQSMFSLYPSLLTQASASNLAASKGALTNAIASYLAASDFIRNSRTPGQPRLFNLAADETDNEAAFRNTLTNLLLSLNQPVQFAANDSFSIYAGAYFSGAKSLRSLVPQFNGDTYVNGTTPDYTFGGFLVGQPAYVVESGLRRKFHSYAGIYVGDGSLQDSLGHSGSFAVFVDTNRQATILGYDEGDGSDDGTAFGVDVHFPLGKGNWSFTKAGMSGSGSISKDGSVFGELDYTNGTSVFLSGNQQPDTGTYQAAAGYYAGTYTGSPGGIVQGILTPAGELFFAPLNANGSVGNGSSTTLNPDNSFIASSTSGTVVTGLLNNATMQITGRYFTSSSASGTFSMSRSGREMFETPPVITANLPATVTAPLGNNVTFSVNAAGSPPLSYQWYSNSVIIPTATAKSFVIHGAQYDSAGLYTVTINNLSGETNASVTLNVIPEITAPTNRILTPISGMLVSNASFVVTGKASDNVGVADVKVSPDGVSWLTADSNNQFTNWSSTVNLSAGTNTIYSYAVDTSGNYSPTSTVKMIYILSAQLTVSTNGKGSISPAYNGALLQIGKNFTLTASPAIGFAFTNWTDGSSFIVTNKPALTFLMASNLSFTANFIDITRPTVAVTNIPLSGNVSNELFTLKGKAGDNVAVTNVSYNLNNAGWNWASSANSFTNWFAADLNLMPGTNFISVYALDSTGNASLTNTVKVVYILSAQLTVSTNGKGSISPAYNNALLQIGKNYTMTATPAVGFVFTNWTDGGSTIITNKPALTFLMASNLSFTANFIDIARPTVSVTNIPTNGNLSNGLFTVKGKAGDNVAVTNVSYNLNNTGWLGADSTNNFINWSAGLTLTPGTNSLATYAVDSSGNYSLTNTVRLIYILSAQLTVSTNGKGSIAPAYNNALLQIGKNYTMTATPAVGFVFTNWTDGSSSTIITNKQVLTFLMASNLSFTANFIDITRPMLTVLTPTAATSAGNELYLATGNASDNAAVTNVYYNLNGMGWAPVDPTNNYGNWRVTLDLTPGTNYFSAYAIDSSSNVSITNNIKFLYTTAPSTLSSLAAAITPDDGAIAPFGVAFGAATFSQASPETTNDNNGVGSYTYTKQTPSRGQLKFTYVAPPSATNGGQHTINLAFTAPNVARYTNDQAHTGGILFTSTPTLVPASLVNQTVIAVNEQGKGQSIAFTAGKYVSSNLLDHTIKTNTSYTYTIYSPLGALIHKSGTNSQSYVVFTFLGTNYGTAYSESYDGPGVFTDAHRSAFGLASQRAGGNALTNLVQRRALVFNGVGASQFSFPDTNNFVQMEFTDPGTTIGLGNYVYARTGTNTASLDLNYTSPSPSLLTVPFLFVAPNFAIFTNLDSTFGATVFK